MVLRPCTNPPILAGEEDEMTNPGLLLSAAINLNQPGRYFHWNIFIISEANLALIGAMVVIFGLALVIPFPKSHKVEGDVSLYSDALPGPIPAKRSEAAGDSSRMWTYRIRSRFVRLLPPERLVPDRQPAYVASWVYTFGVATLAALAVAIVSGFAIALGGPDWWQTNSVGHFFNSLHLWSVEIFMAFMVIHLWGKFWMAAWRGKRARTWITGVLAFVLSVVEAFTGYLSQQNFDAQWISTNGKDAFNAVGVGAFFNLMNFGQMLLWHVVLVPIILVAIVGIHVLLVRVKGVSHPLPSGKADRGIDRPRMSRRARAAADAAEWTGPTRRYDIAKEATVATVVVLLLTFLLAGLLSSPDVPSVTIRTWAQVAPADFLGTAAGELAGTTETATYGPPYNNGSSNIQRIGFSLQTLIGVHDPINTSESFVLGPLSGVAFSDQALAAALSEYRAAPASTATAWLTAYTNALTSVKFSNGVPEVPRANDGPVPLLMSTELSLAQSGGLDADLVAQHPFYGTDYTKPLLFLEDGSYFANQAEAQHLTGTQWGVMNETGSYPGQPWLWLYQLWYQFPHFRTSANVDLIAIYLTGAATILLLAVPFIPGLRDIPRLIPLHRLVWRDYNKMNQSPPSAGVVPSSGAAQPTRELTPTEGGNGPP
jgi:hypothetical protein